MKKMKGITLISLVITIIVLIILAGVSINLTIGENGIFTKAKEAKKAQIISEAKEKIGAEILAAQVEAIERNEELEQSQVEDIISKYGELKEDKDTIILKENNYEISLLDIYQGTTTTTGSYTENKAKVELLEEQVSRLQEQLDSMSQTGDEKDKTIAELNEKVTTIENEKNELQNENNSLTNKATELTNLKETLAKTNATEENILKDYKAYSNGKLITGKYEGNISSIGSIYSNYASDSYDSGWTQTVLGFDTIRYYLLGTEANRWSRLWVDGKLVTQSNNNSANSGVYHIDPSISHTIKVGTDYKCGNAYYSLDNSNEKSYLGRVYSYNHIDSYDVGPTVTVEGVNTVEYYLYGSAANRWSRIYIDGQLIDSKNSGSTTGSYTIDSNVSHTIKITTDYKCGNAYFTCKNT